jgi:hypothetical protein
MLLDAEGKRQVIRNHAKYFELTTFIETGSADGNNIIALNDDFELLITVEIDRDNYHQVARNTLYMPKIKCWWGDSEIVMPYLMRMVTEPALVYLDAHWNGRQVGKSGHTPVRAELNDVLLVGIPHVLLIDDAHQFGKDPDYPTLPWVENYVRERGYEFFMEDDIIRCVPKALL